MSTSRQPSIPTQVNRESKASASRIVSLYRSILDKVPNHDASIILRAREELLICTESQAPRALLLQGQRVTPCTITLGFVACVAPDADAAVESGGGEDAAGAGSGGCEMVYADIVWGVEGLKQGEGGRGGVVDVDV